MKERQMLTAETCWVWEVGLLQRSPLADTLSSELKEAREWAISPPCPQKASHAFPPDIYHVPAALKLSEWAARRLPDSPRAQAVSVVSLPLCVGTLRSHDRQQARLPCCLCLYLPELAQTAVHGVNDAIQPFPLSPRGKDHQTFFFNAVPCNTGS